MSIRQNAFPLSQETTKKPPVSNTQGNTYIIYILSSLVMCSVQMTQSVDVDNNAAARYIDKCPSAVDTVRGLTNRAFINRFDYIS